jgi:hypothetical protein
MAAIIFWDALVLLLTWAEMKSGVGPTAYPVKLSERTRTKLYVTGHQM